MLEPASPRKTGTPPIPPKTPEKLGPLGEKLLKGKSLQKSASLKGQLNFDQFIRTAKPLPHAGPVASAGPDRVPLDVEKSVEPGQVAEALSILERGNRHLTKSSNINSLRAPLESPELQLFAQQRHGALTLLAQAGNWAPRESLNLYEQAGQLAWACLKNLTDPQYFEPPENIAPILDFYIQTHPQVTYGDLQETMNYLETCYEGGLERYANYRELKQAVAARLRPVRRGQTGPGPAEG
ncbi:hypothetical protein [Vampirovibrio chlorellavorus]|uniref:hypothetical protein n=1 Tax=Vampirovibrio chlorellavorus TaxID=758823 RepID=UPI0026EEF549|nr:hypothetical protein [Vampirovibrio chlorellavorus]